MLYGNEKRIIIIVLDHSFSCKNICSNSISWLNVDNCRFVLKTSQQNKLQQPLKKLVIFFLNLNSYLSTTWRSSHFNATIPSLGHWNLRICMKNYRDHRRLNALGIFHDSYGVLFVDSYDFFFEITNTSYIFLIKIFLSSLYQTPESSFTRIYLAYGYMDTGR